MKQTTRPGASRATSWRRTGSGSGWPRAGTACTGSGCEPGPAGLGSAWGVLAQLGLAGMVSFSDSPDWLLGFPP